MRTDSIALAVVLVATTLAHVPEAEARGRRSVRAAFVPAATGSIGSESAARAAQDAPAAALPPATPQAMPRPVPPVAAPLAAPSATSVKETRTAQAWCERGRIVGSGAGFCEMN